MSIKSRVTVWCLRAGVAVLLFFILTMGAVYAYMQQDPQELVSTWLSPISRKTGLNFEIGSVDVTLLPLPAIAISDLRITGKNLDFTLAWGQARPSFLELLRGNLFPGTILLLRAKMLLTTDLPLDDPSQLYTLLNDYCQLSPPSSIPFSMPGNFRLGIGQFDATISGAADSSLSLANLEADLDIWKNGNIAGNIRFPALRLWKNRRIRMASLEHFSISGKTNFHNFATDTTGLRIHGIAKITDILYNMEFGCELDSYSSGWTGKGKLEGILDLAGTKVPFSLLGRLTSVEPGQTIALRGLDWQLDQDSGSLNAEIILPTKDKPFALNGSLYANRVSLTQWLGFARNLPPGLQLALDNITAAKLQFKLTSKGLEVPDIIATCTGATFRGSGGVADFTHPVVALSLEAPKVNLALGLPESIGSSPQGPSFSHPPLTPLPGEPLKPGETGLGYDIRLTAKLVRYGYVNISNASLRIHPGKLDKSGLEDVLLDGKGSFYGGSISGTCILGADPSLPMHITAKARSISGPSLTKDMPLLPFRQGKWDGDAVVTSRGKKLAPFLANLRGDVSISGTNATLAATGTKYIFTKFSTSTKLRSGLWANNNLTFDGLWNIKATNKDFEGTAVLDGKMAFGESGLTLRQLPSNINLILYASPLPPNTKIKISGKITAQTSKDNFELTGGSIQLPGMKLTCTARFDGDKNNMQGTVATEIANVKQSLKHLGINFQDIPPTFNRVKVTTQYLATASEIKLSKIQGVIGAVTIGGSLDYSMHTPPDLQLALTLGDMAFFNTASSKTPHITWNFPIFTTFNASGQIKINLLNLWNTKLKNCVCTFKLHDGLLNISRLSSNFYGASLTGQIRADFRKGLHVDSDLKVHAFDLGAAAKDQKLDIRLKGQASLDISARLNLSGQMELTRALNGHWRFSINDGGWQTVDKKGQPKGKAIDFKSVFASGSLENGTLRSKNFELSSPDLTVTGGGWLNLTKKDMDCNFNVNMKGVPDFPLRAYGSVSNVKTSIGAGKLIWNAVGEVSSGFVEAIGGILKGAWSIFKK